MSDQTKNDLVSTGTLGVIGGVEGYGLGKVFKHTRLGKLPWYGQVAVGVPITLAADYAGIKLSNKINQTRNPNFKPSEQGH